MTEALIQHPMAIVAVFFTVIMLSFHLPTIPRLGRILRFTPPILFAYFIPTALTTLGILPADASVYKWIKTFLLPVSLFLFTMSLDLPMIIRLGPKALIMFLAGTLGIMIGGPLSLFLFRQWLPEDAWQGLAALCGSWIGGGANFVALSQAVGTPESLLGAMIVVDVAVASVWMGILIYFSQNQERMDQWLKADSSAIDNVRKKIENFQTSVSRVSSFQDFITLIGMAFVFTWLAYALGGALPKLGDFVDATTWRVVLITAFGVAVSFTPLRNLEGAGASRLGSVALYLLITTIGAQADLRGLVEYPVFILVGVVWMAIHGAVLFIVAKLTRSPIFFLAVGSQANVGAAASAPVVAASFHPALAPVGILLAIFGYVLGTYAGLVTGYILRWVAML